MAASELADVIDALKKPTVLIIPELIAKATGATSEWLMDRRNARAMPHRLERCKYVVVRNLDRDDGRWRIDGKRLVIYGRSDVSAQERKAAAERKVAELEKTAKTASA